MAKRKVPLRQAPFAAYGRPVSEAEGIAVVAACDVRLWLKQSTRRREPQPLIRIIFFMSSFSSKKTLSMKSMVVASVITMVLQRRRELRAQEILASSHNAPSCHFFIQTIENAVMSCQLRPCMLMGTELRTFIVTQTNHPCAWYMIMVIVWELVTVTAVICAH